MEQSAVGFVRYVVAFHHFDTGVMASKRRCEKNSLENHHPIHQVNRISEVNLYVARLMNPRSHFPGSFNSHVSRYACLQLEVFVTG